MTNASDIEDKTAPLRADVRMLGQFLGDAIREHEGPACFLAVEGVRRLAKRARGGDASAADSLSGFLRALSPAHAITVARAFAQFLTLANIAEKHHRARRRRDYQRDPGGPLQRGSLEDSFSRLRASGVEAERLHELVCDMDVELVLTAHPTEVNRRTVLFKHSRIADLLHENDRSDLTPREREDVREAIRREIVSIWYTDEIQRRRPTPVREANAGLLVFEQTLWDALPHYARSLDDALLRHTGRGLPLDRAPIHFGSWMGGDRDGNPNVTPTVTRRVCALARWMAADLYSRELKALRDELSFEAMSDELREEVGGSPDPYRHVLRRLHERMEHTRAWMEARVHGDALPDGDPLLDVEELRRPLLLVWRSLHEIGAAEVARGRLLDILRRVASLGLTLVRLDIRQDAGRHTEALDAVTRYLGLGSYEAWSEEERLAFLEAELASRRPLIPTDMPMSDDVRDVLETFDVIREQAPGSLGAYVISMASQPSDVLAVKLLQKATCVSNPLRVVPLFETRDDLAHAGDTLAALLDTPSFRERVQARGDRVEVMVGYSDSAKDAGLLTASWALYQAQEEMATVCQRRGVKLTLFHGRGGTAARGGAPAHMAITGLPPGTVGGTMRVTEQGEMIQAKFGLRCIALRNLALYTTAVAEAALTPPPAPEPAWRALMDEMSSVAVRGFRDIVRGDPEFVPYFRTVTPERELGSLNIGSRPARRRAGGGVESLRAIPWIFAWTQTRLLLPSWLGVGPALRFALDSPDRDTLRDMAARWPFFRNFLSLEEMVLAKADPDVHARYARLLIPPDLRDLSARLRHSLTETVRAVLETLDQDELLASNPVLRRSIEVRNPYVDPLNLLQSELLRRYRATNDPIYRDPLLVTVNGVAAGMRNTG